MSVIVLVTAIGCVNKNDDNQIQNGEIVVIQDKTDTVIGAYNIDTLNPIATKSKSSQRITNIIYESLFSYNEDLSIEPMLAESYFLSQDGRGITVNLKRNVLWQDGSPFTTGDVTYTLGKITSSDGIYSKIGKKIKNYSVSGENSVYIEFHNPEPDFSYLLTFPIISANSQYTTDDSFVPMGTGSYKLASRTSTELYLEPFSSWHGGQPSEKKLTVKFLKDENTATNALNVKEIDAVALESYTQDTNIPKLNATSYEITTNNMVFLGFNTASAVMTQNVRRAIVEIVNKQKLLENNAYGKGKICSLSVNPASWASKIPEIEHIDVDELFGNDGYKIVNGAYTKDDVVHHSSIIVNEDNPSRCKIAEGICEMLKASGMDVQVEYLSYDNYIQRINSDSFDMFIGEIETSPNINPGAMLDNLDNYFNFDTTYLTDAKSTLFGIAERDNIKTALEAYQKRFYINPPYLPLFYKNDVIIYGSYVSGITTPTLFDAYKNIENWYFYDKDGSEKLSADKEGKIDE